MARRMLLLCALVATLGVAWLAPATAAAQRTISSEWRYNAGQVRASGLTCDTSIYYVCGVGTFDGVAALSQIQYPGEGEFLDACVRYPVDEVIRFLDGSGSLTLSHVADVCPPNPNWFKNRGFGSYGNPFYVTSTWTVTGGSGSWSGTTGAGTWTAHWAGNAGSGSHAGVLTMP